MLTVHFGIRPEEYEGFVVLFNRVVKEVQLPVASPLVSIGDSWDMWGDYVIGDPRHVHFDTLYPMVTIQSLVELFAPYFMHSMNKGRENVRIIITDSSGDELEELRW